MALHVVVEQAKQPVVGLVDQMTVCFALAVGVGCTQVTASWIEDSCCHSPHLRRHSSNLCSPPLCLVFGLLFGLHLGLA